MAPEKYDSPNFIGALALHQHRRDTAIGLLHVTTAQKGLLWYYGSKQRELASKYTRTAIAKSLIDSIDGRMAEIMREAQTATLERKRELLTEALKLKKEAQRIRNLNG